MSAIPRFAAYAAVFEKAAASDDWSLVEPFFAEAADYEVGLGAPFSAGESLLRGRAAILEHFHWVFEAFDRRFATREVVLLEGPEESEDTVWVRGRAIYTTPQAPELSFELEERATYAGEQIVRLEDRYDEATARSLRDYVARHGAALGLGG